jgi:hypothetical protein
MDAERQRRTKMKTYIIMIINLNDPDETCYWSRGKRINPTVVASSPEAALRMRGFVPDECGDTSGGDPRNEYGYPWYPYVKAEEFNPRIHGDLMG